MVKVLVIAPHRKNRAPSQRFRFEQYMPFLKDNGIEFELSPLVDKSDDVVLYSKGNYLKKALIEIKSWKKRFKDLKRAKDFDAVFIHREALMTFSLFFEKKIAERNPNIIYDFDDSIWLPEVSEGNQNLQVLKRPEKVNKTMSLSKLIFAGNSYLANYASQYCSNVKIIPTTIDTDYHKPSKRFNNETVCIGWTGTQTTLKFLRTISSVFVDLKKKYGDRVRFKIICDTKPEWFPVEFTFTKWNLEEEIAQLNELDIGIMPLTDNQWTRGKCGFKGLQYMAVEAATVMSPVGVNNEIIDHGKNGYLAQSNDEWVNYLSCLIESKDLREQLGKAGRKTIIEKYSISSQKHRYLKYIKELTEN